MDIQEINKLFIYEEREEIENNKKDNILFNYNASDREIIHSHGFSLQHTATRDNCFAKPYYNFKNISPVTKFIEDRNCKYDLSFIGQRCVRGTVRNYFLHKLEQCMFIEGIENFYNWRIKTIKKHFYHFKEDDRIQLNNKVKYKEIMNESNFVLCPMGYSMTSIRFFEALAVNSIPIYIGNKEQKMPLDWLIDWDKVIFRINTEDIIDGSFWDKIKNILRSTKEEVIDRRHLIYELYWKYFDNEKFHDKCVKERIIELLTKSETGDKR